MPVFRVKYYQTSTVFEELYVDIQAPDQHALEAILDDPAFDVNMVAEEAGTTWQERMTEADSGPTLDEDIYEFPDDGTVQPDITLVAIRSVIAKNSTVPSDEPEPVQ